jgi:hypothetical protein
MCYPLSSPPCSRSLPYIEMLHHHCVPPLLRLPTARAKPGMHLLSHMCPRLILLMHTEIQNTYTVLLSTTHRHKEYKDGDKAHVAKFVCCYDGPYCIMSAFPDTSTYTLNLPNTPHTFNTFHSSQLHCFIPNDDACFLGCEVSLQNQIYNEFSEAEFLLDKIIAECCISCGFQYLVTWVSKGNEENQWLPRHKLEDCEVLDKWLMAKKLLLSEGD